MYICSHMLCVPILPVYTVNALKILNLECQGQFYLPLSKHLEKFTMLTDQIIHTLKMSLALVNPCVKITQF